MVQVMLYEAVELKIDRAGSSAHGGVQVGIVQARDRGHQVTVALLQGVQCHLPGACTRIAHGRPFPHSCQFDHFTLDAPTDADMPGRDVIDDFPNAVHVGNWPGCGAFGGDIGEQFPDRRAMPRVALEGALELIGNSLNFGHSSSIALRPHGPVSHPIQ